MTRFFKAQKETELLKQTLYQVERERDMFAEEFKRAQRKLEELETRGEKPGDYCRICRNALNSEAASGVFIQCCECTRLIPCPHFKLKE